MAGELLKNLTGIDIQHVPYKGSTGMRSDILSGQIQMLFDSVPTMAPLIKSGMVRALGTSGLQALADPARRADHRRSRRAGFQAALWVGFMAPKAVPQPIVDLLQPTPSPAFCSRPDLQEAWARQGATALTMTQSDTPAFLQARSPNGLRSIDANHIAQSRSKSAE